MPKPNRVAINRVYQKAHKAMGAHWPESDAAMNRRIVRFLLERNYPENDIVGCAAYVGRERQVRPLDMRRVRTVLPSWIKAGRPKAPVKDGEGIRVGGSEGYGPPPEKRNLWLERIRRRRKKDV